jgi:hypothetical protein
LDLLAKLASQLSQLGHRQRRQQARNSGSYGKKRNIMARQGTAASVGLSTLATTLPVF